MPAERTSTKTSKVLSSLEKKWNNMHNSCSRRHFHLLTQRVRRIQIGVWLYVTPSFILSHLIFIRPSCLLLLHLLLPNFYEQHPSLKASFQIPVIILTKSQSPAPIFSPSLFPSLLSSLQLFLPPSQLSFGFALPSDNYSSYPSSTAKSILPQPAFFPLQILTSPSGSWAWGVSWWLGVSQSGL